MDTAMTEHDEREAFIKGMGLDRPVTEMFDAPEPLLVTPKAAFAALSIGITKGYELMGSGDLEAVKIGRATRITWQSVKRLVASAPRGTDERYRPSPASNSHSTA